MKDETQELAIAIYYCVQINFPDFEQRFRLIWETIPKVWYPTEKQEIYLYT